MSPVSKILGKNRLDAESRKAIVRLNRFYLFLSNINEAMIIYRDRQELLNQICRISVVDGGFLYSRISLLDENGNTYVAAEYGPTLEDWRLQIRNSRFEACTRRVVETNEILVINDSSELETLVPGLSGKPGACKSIASFPIGNGDGLRGVLSLNSDEPGFFRQVETGLLKQIAGNINVVLNGMENEEKKLAAEKLLRESQERYADLYENSPDMFISVNPETARITGCNETLCRVTGYTKAELTGKHLMELYHPDSHEQFKRNLVIFKEKGAITNAELKIVTKNGSTRDVLLNTSAVKDENGQILYSRSVWRDITETKKREIAESRLWRILRESINEIYIFNGTTLKFEFVNEGALNNLGYSTSEMRGMTPIEIETGISKEQFRLRLEPLLHDNESRVIYETRHRRKDGSFYDAEVHLQYLAHENDKVFLAAVLDITAEKRRKEIEQLRYHIARAIVSIENTGELLTTIHNEIKSSVKADNFYVAMYDENSGMMNKLLENDEQGPHLSLPAEGTLCGYVIQKGCPVLLREQDIKQLVQDNIIDMPGTSAKAWLGVPLILEGRVKGVMVAQNHGDENAFDNSSITILEVMADEFSLFKENKEPELLARKISKVITESQIIVMITDLAGKIKYVNPEFTNVTGYTSGEVTGESPAILKSGNKSKAEYKQLWDTILSGQDWHGEFLNKKKNGELYWEEAVISPVKDADGNITNFIAIKEDITAKRIAMEELVQAKNLAEEMSRLKTNFLANMSHELRTPLNGILGFSEILAEEAMDPQTRDIGVMINKSGKRLLETLDLILDLSRIEAGKLDIKSEEMDIIRLANEVLTPYKTEAEQKGLFLKADLQPGIMTFMSDNRLLSGIIKNLVDNAIKFTRDGGVTLEITAGNNDLVLTVTDTGIGIPLEQREVIWEEFRQASEGLSRNFEGAGLGLTLTRTYVSKLGGKITLESKPGTGSTFTVSLPVKFLKKTGAYTTSGEGISAPHASQGTTSGTTSILLVEDDLSNIQFVSFMLSGAYNVDTCMDGNSALEAISKKNYDLILMDINLGSGMNGLEVTKKLRQLPGYEKTPVIALTAYAVAFDREELLEAGCSHLLLKPFSRKDFLEIIKTALSNH